MTTYHELRAGRLLCGDLDDALRAQAEATLALVEQVRISNVIALADKHPFVETAAGFQGLDGLLTRVEDRDGVRRDKLRPEIAAALDLEKGA